ncbi:cache domain-containing protein [Methanorbis rubei]|uniref:Single Cache domain-containing protein n=1 Tax=Methanorbis rubei TaxID=3028300 RepID=A0AAE4MFT2_9EURY|nr:hypothetical protein [Methanocorpusculaceae archaeon Cs1]
MKYLICLILGICMVMSVCTAGCVFLPQDQPDLSGNYDEQIEFAHKLVLSIDNQITDLGDSLFAAAEYQSDFAADSPEVIASLSDLYVDNPGSSSIYRINADNVVVAAVPESAAPRIGYHIPALDFDPHNLSSPAYMGLYHRENTGETRVSILVPIYTGNGTYDGLLCLILDPKTKTFVSPSRPELPREGFTVMILDENGNVLYSDETKHIGQNAIQLANVSGQDETVAVLERMISTTNGTASYSTYSFGSMKYVTLAVAWDTLETRIGPLTFVVGKKTSEQQLVPRPSSSTDKTLEEFARAAYLYAVKNGKDAAVAAFNDPESLFVTQEYTITAVDINGTILANAMLPGDVGVNLITDTDANGVPTVKTLVQRAKQGGGYAMYLYPDHMQNEEIKVKLSYVMPVDDTWFIVAGNYTDNKAKYVDPLLRNTMIEYTRQVAQYAAINGKDAAITALNTPHGQFYREDIRLVATDSNGTVFARPFNPELIGTNLQNVTDIYGVSLGRDLTVMANSGGGMIYQYYPNRYTNENEMTLIYVLPVDNTWFLSSGITMTACP